MKIGLIDVDSHNFPNLCLMKIAAYHKSRKDEVEWWNGLLHYDRVYQSKVFDETYSQDTDWIINAEEVIRGGNGYDIKSELPEEVEHQRPDYALYNITEKAYGYLTRGCPKSCPFCLVSQKEGRKTHQVADIDEFWRGEKNIVLLDPNITAAKECEKLFDDLISTKAQIDFTQGIDVQLLTDKGADQLNRMKTKMIHFAWDSYEMKTYEKLKEIKPLIKKSSRGIRVYVLTNYNTTLEQDLERIYKLRDLGYDPYVMVYNKPQAPKEIRKLQRWVNAKWVFYSVDRFEDYRR